ncbi:hypothetical protein VCRLGP7_20061 [Vibrio crassostreae]|nr:hypothetical protein VCRA2134O405_180099 [Vibrio crassostreae]CAK3791623.1 hypothetical protein VCRA2126O398_170008 [Vibrio crassostreae]CDT07420.1 hypothetical protein VCRLGP7_20061 [Vibrio crassostreae]
MYPSIAVPFRVVPVDDEAVSEPPPPQAIKEADKTVAAIDVVYDFIMFPF